MWQSVRSDDWNLEIILFSSTSEKTYLVLNVSRRNISPVRKTMHKKLEVSPTTEAQHASEI